MRSVGRVEVAQHRLLASLLLKDDAVRVAGSSWQDVLCGSTSAVRRCVKCTQSLIRRAESYIYDNHTNSEMRCCC